MPQIIATATYCHGIKLNLIMISKILWINKKHVLLFLLTSFLFALKTKAQETPQKASYGQEVSESQDQIKTLFDNNKQNAFGGFGTPLFGIGKFADQWNAVIGGKGGVIINRKVALGLVGMGKAGSTPIENDIGTYDNAHFSYGTGGLFVEFLAGLTNPIHLSFPINFMIGGTSVEQKVEEGEDIDIESSGLYVVEPGISIEFNVTRYFVPSLQVSYRNVFLNDEMDYVNESDLSGLYIGLNFKFGKF